MNEITQLYQRLVDIEEKVNETLSWAARTVKRLEQVYAACDGLPGKFAYVEQNKHKLEVTQITK